MVSEPGGGGSIDRHHALHGFRRRGVGDIETRRGAVRGSDHAEVEQRVKHIGSIRVGDPLIGRECPRPCLGELTGGGRRGRHQCLVVRAPDHAECNARRIIMNERQMPQVDLQIIDARSRGKRLGIGYGERVGALLICDALAV